MCDHINTSIVFSITEVSNFLAFNSGNEGDLEIAAAGLGWLRIEDLSEWTCSRRRSMCTASWSSQGSHASTRTAQLKEIGRNETFLRYSGVCRHDHR